MCVTESVIGRYCKYCVKPADGSWNEKQRTSIHAVNICSVNWVEYSSSMAVMFVVVFGGICKQKAGTGAHFCSYAGGKFKYVLLVEVTAGGKFKHVVLVEGKWRNFPVKHHLWSRLPCFSGK